MKRLVYPQKESIVFINEIINIMSNRKADQHRLLGSDIFIANAIEKTRNEKGDLYDKAAVLLHGLVTIHGFASGNKRTGFIVMTYFLNKNGGKIKIRSFNKAEHIIKNISRFKIQEIASWLRTGEINEEKIQ